MRGVNGVVNGHGIYGHEMDSDSEVEDEEMGGISEELERELEAFVPESYRQALGQGNATASTSTADSASVPVPQSSSSTFPASSSTSVDRDQARRVQSDQASERIGTLMLQGYTLLSTLCSNPGCYAIPLVGHPRRRPAGGSSAAAAVAGQKKECVVCGKIWEADGSVSRESVGQREVVVAPVPSVAAATGASETTARARTATTNGQEAESGTGSGAGSTIRDITREEAMRIYAGESPAQVIGAGVRASVSSNLPREPAAVPLATAGPAQCRSIVTDEDHALILEDTYQAMLDMLDRANKRLAGVTEGSQAALDGYVLSGHSSKLLDTIDKLVNGLETVRKAKKSM